MSYSFASGRLEPFVAHSDAAILDGVFSPDGHYVAYSSNESGRMEVYVTTFPSAIEMAKTAATTIPTATSAIHTSVGGDSRPTAHHASGSKQSAAVTSAALTHDRSTRQRCPSHPNAGPVTSPARM
jgi:roadblock/LC7 domain-containing protein